MKYPGDFGPERAQESIKAIANRTKICGQVVASETACLAEMMVVVKREVSDVTDKKESDVGNVTSFLFWIFGLCSQPSDCDVTTFLSGCSPCISG